MEKLYKQYKHKQAELLEMFQNGVSPNCLIYKVCRSEFDLIISEMEFHIKNKAGTLA